MILKPKSLQRVLYIAVAFFMSIVDNIVRCKKNAHLQIHYIIDFW